AAHAIRARETRPFGSDSLAPGVEDHVLTRAAAVRHAVLALLFLIGDDDGRGRIRHVRPGPNQGAELAQVGPIAHDYEMPWLAIRRARAHAARLDDSPEDLARNGFVLVLAHRHHGPRSLENLICHP